MPKIIATTLAVLALLATPAMAAEIGPAPTVPTPVPALSQAQARWFTEHVVHPWAPHAHYQACWRLSSVIVACPFVWYTGHKLMHSTEVAELTQPNHILIELATSGVPLTRAETETFLR